MKILKNKWYRAKVLAKRFDLNGHTKGICQQAKKLELHFYNHVFIIASGSERVLINPSPDHVLFILITLLANFLLTRGVPKHFGEITQFMIYNENFFIWYSVCI